MTGMGIALMPVPFFMWRVTNNVNNTTCNIHAAVLRPVLWDQLHTEYDPEDDMADGGHCHGEELQ